MQRRALYISKAESNLSGLNTSQNSSLSLQELERYAQDWLFDGEYRQHSPLTIKGKRDVVNKLFWFLRHKSFTHCGTTELRQFLAYVANGHREPGGRWGNPRYTQPATRRTVRYYYTYMHGLFKWIVAEELLAASPMERIAAPQSTSQQIQPFTQEHIEQMVQACESSEFPLRDEAIIRFLLDTGVRVSELCGLKMRELDLFGRRAEVTGKGRKKRQVFFGKNTARALRNYLRDENRMPDEAVFASRAEGAGEGLTRSGVLQLIRKTGRRAGLQAVRCSPHTFRHTFAIEFLRNGGNVFSLQQLLGHSGLQVTSRYISLAQADMENQHRQFSPGDRLGK